MSRPKCCNSKICFATLARPLHSEQGFLAPYRLGQACLDTVQAELGSEWVELPEQAARLDAFVALGTGDTHSPGTCESARRHQSPGNRYPVINLALKLGMRTTEHTERSAIVVTEVQGMVMGLFVDQVPDILMVPANLLQPVPDVTMSGTTAFSEGIIAQPNGMICFLNLKRMFNRSEAELIAA